MSDNVNEPAETTEDADGAAVDTDPDSIDGGDTTTFPRAVVERLRRESASYRDRAKAVEGRLSAMQRQAVEAQVAAAGMQPAALFAVAQLDDLLAEDGTVDAAAVTAAMDTARELLGIGHRPAPRRPVGEMVSGAVARSDPDYGQGFASAFRQRER